MGSGAGSRVVAGVLAFVTGLLVVVAVAAGWISGTALDTPTFVARVGPAIDDPSVRAAVATELSDQLVGALDRQRTAANLPSAVAFAAGHLGGTLDRVVRAQVTRLVGSPAFVALWYDALGLAHRQAVALLTATSGAAQVVDGRVVVDLVALVPAVLADLQHQLPGAFGTGLPSLPVPPGTPADQVRRQVASLLGVQLPSDFGRVAVMDASVLDTARLAARALRTAAPAALVGAAVALVLGLLVSPRRARTLAQAALWTCVLLALAYLAVRTLTSRLLTGLADQTLRPALDAAARQVLGSLGIWAVATFAGALAVALLAYLVGRRTPPLATA